MLAQQRHIHGRLQVGLPAGPKDLALRHIALMARLFGSKQGHDSKVACSTTSFDLQSGSHVLIRTLASTARCTSGRYCAEQAFGTNYSDMSLEQCAALCQAKGCSYIQYDCNKARCNSTIFAQVGAV